MGGALSLLEGRTEYGYERLMKNNDLQDGFLKRLCESKKPVTVFLVNGVKLQGVVMAHDETSLLLGREAHEQLVFKSAISTIMPHDKVRLAEGGEPKE